MNGPPDTVWKFIATSAISFLLGIGVPYFLNGKDVMTKQDLALAIVPIQKQLDDLQKADGENKAEIVQLEIDVARLSEQLGVTARPTAPPH